MDIDKKLETLRKKYPSIESQTKIDEDEKSLRVLLIQKDFASNELVQKILTDARERIENINFLLSYDETLNLPESVQKRYALYRTREVWQFIVDRLGGKEIVEQQIQQIEEQLDAELNRSEA